MRQIQSQADLDAGIQAGETEFAVGKNLTINIYTSVTVHVRHSSPNIVVRANGNPTIQVSHDSNPAAVAMNKSSPTIWTQGNSSPTVVARNYSSPTILACEDSSPILKAGGHSCPYILAQDSSSPSIRASNNSSPSVRAWGNSRPSVSACDESKPRVEAIGFAFVRLLGSVAQITARLSESAVCLCHGSTDSIHGGKIHRAEHPQTPKEWCHHWGVPIVDGVAILYKAVDLHFSALVGGSYRPGSTPTAPNQDSNMGEHGEGLLFSPRPWIAKEQFQDAKRFVACPVAIKDMSLRSGTEYMVTSKTIEAKGCCEPVWECDKDGNLIEQPAEHQLPATQVLKEAPEDIRPVLKSIFACHRGIVTKGEMRGTVFEHIRPDNLLMLEKHLGLLFGEPPAGTSHVVAWLADCLNDEDWSLAVREDPLPSAQEESAAEVWERHQTGIAAVKDYAERERRRQVVKEAPISIKESLNSIHLCDRGVLDKGELHWRVFHGLRSDNLPLLEEYLGKLFGQPVTGTSNIEIWLQNCLNDDDWPTPPSNSNASSNPLIQQKIKENYERHRAGIAAVREYLESDSPD